MAETTADRGTNAPLPWRTHGFGVPEAGVSAAGPSPPPAPWRGPSRTAEAPVAPLQTVCRGVGGGHKGEKGGGGLGRGAGA